MRTVRELNRLRNNNLILSWLVFGLVLAVLGLSITLAYERGDNNSPKEQGVEQGKEQGWQECIEENNLYEKYGKELKW